VTLWRPTGQAELDLVAASRWRRWPPRLPEQPAFCPVLSRWYATKIAREWNVPREGVGYVTRFDVRRDYLEQFPVQQAGGRDVLEYWIPAGQLGDFNASIDGAITEQARYAAPVTDADFTTAENRLGARFPAPWRAYLQGRSWLTRGWLPSGCYLSLLTPQESASAAGAWEPSAAAFPGLLLLGSDGAREWLTVDARDPDAPVTLLDITAESWADAIEQLPAGEFTAQVEAGTFDFTFG
jgi:hypothetical protein